MDLRSLGIVQREHNFVGSFRHVVDSQGRVQFPRSFRKAMRADAQDTLVITGDQDGCLIAYTISDWDKVHAVWQEAATDANGRPVRDLIRGLFRGAVEVRIDAQGRISLPTQLLDRVGIGEEVELLGIGQRIELWSPERLDELTDEDRDRNAGNLLVMLAGRRAENDG